MSVQRCALCLLAALAVSACRDRAPTASPPGQGVRGGGDGDGDGDGDTGGDRDAGGDSDAGGDRDAGAGGLYAVAAEIETRQGTVLHVRTVAELEAPFDVEDGLEIRNASSFEANGDQVFVASSDAPRITRYALDDDGALREDRTLSFVRAGLATAQHFAIISPEKAYTFDYEAYTVHVWDPATMTRMGGIDLREARHESGAPLSLGLLRSQRVQRGEQLIVAGGYGPLAKPLPIAVLLVFDTARDSVQVITSERCVMLGASKLSESGDAYFFAHPRALLAHDAAPCALRIRSGEDDLDARYSLDLRELLGGRVPRDYRAGPGDTVYVEVPEGQDGDALAEVFYERGNNARLWQVDLEAEDADELTRLDPFRMTLPAFELGDGRALLPILELADPDDEAAGYEAQVYEVLEAGEPVAFELGEDSDEVRARLVDIVRLR